MGHFFHKKSRVMGPFSWQAKFLGVRQKKKKKKKKNLNV